MQQSATRTFLVTASHPKRNTRALCVAGLLAAAVASSGLASAQVAGAYQATNILSDGYVSAPVTDAGFIDPWGVSGTTTLWINTNVSGFSYVAKYTGAISFKAVIPPASGTGLGQPTGTVQNTTASGFVLSNATKASFLFSTLDGTISGWNSLQTPGGNNALIAINNSSKNAVYTDLALITNTGGSYLLAPNFGQGGNVEIYNTSFQAATLQGTFSDPNIPAGYAPYAIKAIGTQVFVTYMLRSTPPFAAGAGKYQEVLGTNTGFVSVFDDNGNYIARIVTGGNLNAPWGVAIAPASFGIYGGDLLIGNFGDGLITAYSPTTPYAYLGTVADGTGKPIAYPGLWEIFASTATGADPTALYFTAGLVQETHGLFGVIGNSTTATGPATFNLSASSQVASVASAGASTALIISVAPANSFAGTVTLSCNGLPASAACNFSNSQLTVSAAAPATTTLMLQTSAGSSSTGYIRLGMLNLVHGAKGAFLALLFPFGALLALRRRRFTGLRILGVLVIMLASASLISGCGSSPGMAATPAGTSNVTISATSGGITKSFVVALTVQ